MELIYSAQPKMMSASQQMSILPGSCEEDLCACGIGTRSLPDSYKIWSELCHQIHGADSQSHRVMAESVNGTILLMMQHPWLLDDWRGCTSDMCLLSMRHTSRKPQVWYTLDWFWRYGEFSEQQRV